MLTYDSDTIPFVMLMSPLNQRCPTLGLLLSSLVVAVVQFSEGAASVNLFVTSP